MNNFLTHTLYCPEDRIPILKDAYNLINHTPNLILIDVRDFGHFHVDEIKKSFNIIHEHKYISTNNHSMRMFIITLEPPK